MLQFCIRVPGVRRKLFIEVDALGGHTDPRLKMFQHPHYHGVDILKMMIDLVMEPVARMTRRATSRFAFNAFGLSPMANV
eukprot:9579333-Prorocentrum_lima.AAC.1